MSVVLGLLVLALCIAVLLGAARFVARTSHPTIAPPPPDLWNGETLRLSALAWMQIGADAWSATSGWLYLTDLRLVWVPSGPLIVGLAPVISPPGGPTEEVSIRVTHIKRTERIKRNIYGVGIIVFADGDAFSIWFERSIGRFDVGDARQVDVWLAALSDV